MAKLTLHFCAEAVSRATRTVSMSGMTRRCGTGSEGVPVKSCSRCAPTQRRRSWGTRLPTPRTSRTDRRHAGQRLAHQDTADDHHDSRVVSDPRDVSGSFTSTTKLTKLENFKSLKKTLKIHPRSY